MDNKNTPNICSRIILIPDIINLGRESIFNRGYSQGLDALKNILKTQNEKIAHLESLLGKSEPAPVSEKPVPPAEKITVLPSMKKKIEIGGELEFEFKMIEIDRRPDAVGLFDRGHRQTFDMDKAAIYMKAVWNDALWTFFEIELTEITAHVDTAYAQFDFQIDADSSIFVRAGLDHQFTKYSRTTETYPINGAAFWRVDKSRSREMGGTVLGLSIVKHIAQLHEGSVSVQSQGGSGSTFSLRIPFNS